MKIGWMVAGLAVLVAAGCNDDTEVPAACSAPSQTCEGECVNLQSNALN